MKRDFQNGDGSILLHGAPVKSNFDGFKFPKTDFSRREQSENKEAAAAKAVPDQVLVKLDGPKKADFR